jgi:hypothetical protein
MLRTSNGAAWLSVLPREPSAVLEQHVSPSGVGGRGPPTSHGRAQAGRKQGRRVPPCQPRNSVRHVRHTWGLPSSFRHRRREMGSREASGCCVGRKVPGRAADPFGTQRSTVRSGQRRRRFRRLAHQREWDVPHLRLGKELGPVQGGATALHAAQPLSSAVGTPWPSAFVGELGRDPPIFYRIFYRMVPHRVFRGGMSQHAVAAKTQVSEPVRPLVISAVTPTKQLITRRSRVQIPPPPQNV